MKYHFQYILSTIIASVIFYLTLLYIPSEDNELAKIENMDKVVHVLMFFGFSWAVAFDYTRQRVESSHSNFSMSMRAILLSFLYGGLIEVIQGEFLPERSGDWKDFAADAFGTILGLCVFLFFFKKYIIKLFSSPKKQKSTHPSSE